MKLTKDVYFRGSGMWGNCDLCKRHARLVVDHNHTTGMIRGNLCRRCNGAIPERWENEGWRYAAVEYLARDTGIPYSPKVAGAIQDRASVDSRPSEAFIDHDCL